MIYQLDSKIKNYDQNESTVGEIIQLTQDIENTLDTHDILKFRENVMVKLRNTLYLRAKLNQRLNFFKTSKEKGIGNFISENVSKIWSFGRKKENMEEFIKRVTKEKLQSSQLSTEDVTEGGEDSDEQIVTERGEEVPKNPTEEENESETKFEKIDASMVKSNATKI